MDFVFRLQTGAQGHGHDAFGHRIQPDDSVGPHRHLQGEPANMSTFLID